VARTDESDGLHVCIPRTQRLNAPSRA